MTAASCDAADTAVATLVAGRTMDAGTVRVWNDENNLYVRYVTTGDWKLEQTHVAVAESLDGIPQTRQGNPIPGRFPYQAAHDPLATEFTYTIPLAGLPDSVLVAAHASLVAVDRGGRVLCRETGWADGEDFPGKNWATYFCHVPVVYRDVRLPLDDVRFQIRGWHPNGTYSYWDLELAGVPVGYDVWSGHWNGWCAERTVYMTPGVWYDVSLWSTCSPNLPARVQNAGWDNVNYLLNHKHPDATLFDTEEAIWWLLGSGPYPTDPEAILMAEDAASHGDGWRPRAGSLIAVITETADNVQLCFIEVGL
jgi:hypothetical protein